MYYFALVCKWKDKTKEMGEYNVEHVNVETTTQKSHNCYKGWICFLPSSD